MSKVGSDNARVSRAALLCLRGLADSCCDETAATTSSSRRDVTTLLRQNADYLVDAISLKLRHVERHVEAPRVLQVALHYGGMSVLPLVNDLLQEVWYT